MMKELRKILGIASIEAAWVRRQPLWIFQGFVSSVGITLMMFAWGGTAALKNIAAVFIIIGSWSQGLNIVAQSIGWARISHELERLVASPASLLTYFAGVVLGTSPFMLSMWIPAIIIIFVLNIEIFSLLVLLLLSPVALILGSFTSLLVILNIKNPTNISAITNPLATATTILPPVYYPLSVLPPLLRELMLLFPTVSLMEVARWIFGASPTYGPIIPTMIVIFWLILTTALLVKKVKWGLE